MEDKELIKLLYEKIDLLEKFVIEAAKIAEKNNWSSTDEEMKSLDDLSSRLDELQKKLPKKI